MSPRSACAVSLSLFPRCAFSCHCLSLSALRLSCHFDIFLWMSFVWQAVLYSFARSSFYYLCDCKWNCYIRSKQLKEQIMNSISRMFCSLVLMLPMPSLTLLVMLWVIMRDIFHSLFLQWFNIQPVHGWLHIRIYRQAAFYSENLVMHSKRCFLGALILLLLKKSDIYLPYYYVWLLPTLSNLLSHIEG